MLHIPPVAKLATFAAVLCAIATSYAGDAYDEAPHFYSQAVPDDPVAALAAQIAEEKLKLAEGTDRELTDQFLQSLSISPHSQVLVFSKTSLQRDKITPVNPRAIYFNDETYIGWVPGGMIEFTGLHASLGAYFYSFDPENASRPRKIVRHQNCLDCHAGGMTNHWPGMMIRSVHTDERGFPLLQAGTTLVDHTTPIEQRWGGWYVTGQHGDSRHMGNVLAKEKAGEVVMDREPGANRTTLAGLSIGRESEYLGKGSDIVALMVLEHQIMMQNKLIAASYEVRGAFQRMQLLQKELGEPVTETLQGSALAVAESHTEKILKALLFSEEAALPEGGIEGGAAFRDAFLANRKKDSEGDSLKDFQLLNRLFKHRCSYQIYSRTWLGLPKQLKTMLYEKLRALLEAEAPPAAYSHLGAAERQTILKILRETHPDLKTPWAVK